MSIHAKDFHLFQNLAVHTDNYPRQAYRAFPDNLWIRIKGKQAACRVINISISGICFELPNADKLKKIVAGKCLAVKILSSTREPIMTVIAQIIRKDAMSCSCLFVELTDDNVILLDKLLLEMQKEEIAYVKEQRNIKKKEHADTEEDFKAMPYSSDINEIVKDDLEFETIIDNEKNFTSIKLNMDL